MKDDWINVHDKLPEKNGYYLVYAPEYVGSILQKVVDGMMLAKFSVRTKFWSIERSTAGGKGIVEYWMPLPKKPKGADL